MNLKKIGCTLSLALTLFTTLERTPLEAHCQMPCGIYHDDMIFDFVDQYMETMYKAMSVLNENKFSTVKERNEFVRWVMQKDKMSDETAQLITTYFIQQKIKPGEPDTAKKLESAHKLLFMIVAIKQNTDLQLVKNFGVEWTNFKLMFHIEGYECLMEKKNLDEIMKLREQKEKEAASATSSSSSTPAPKK